MSNKWDTFSNEDYKVVVNQLDREPRGVLGVAKRCSYGFPQIIVNRPINSDEEVVKVFPTMLWLTCPYLKKVISQLESTGMISEIEAKVASDSDFAKALEENHSNHAQKRLSLIPANVQDSLERNYPKEFQVLKETGVGGIRARDGVKCLHTHFADYLALGENVIGKLVSERLDEGFECASGDCALER